MLKKLPEAIEYESTYKLVADDMTPLNIVLLQEVCLCVYGTKRYEIEIEKDCAYVCILLIVHVDPVL